jgi:hypothetical protein
LYILLDLTDQFEKKNSVENFENFGKIEMFVQNLRYLEKRFKSKDNLLVVGIQFEVVVVE